MGRWRLEEGDDNTRSEGQRGKVNSFDKGYLGMKGEGGLVNVSLPVNLPPQSLPATAPEAVCWFCEAIEAWWDLGTGGGVGLSSGGFVYYFFSFYLFFSFFFSNLCKNE